MHGFKYSEQREFSVEFTPSQPAPFGFLMLRYGFSSPLFVLPAMLLGGLLPVFQNSQRSGIGDTGIVFIQNGLKNGVGWRQRPEQRHAGA